MEKSMPAIHIPLFVLIAFLFIPAIHAEVARVEQGNLILEDIPPVPEELGQRIVQYFNSRSANFADWHPNGGMLISTRFADTRQLHLVKTAMGARRQLTFFEEPVFGASFSSTLHHNGFVFLKDVGGSEDYQLFYFDLNTSNHRMLSDGKSRNGAAVWSNAGDRVAYYSNRRNGKSWDIYVVDPSRPGGTRRVLETEDGAWFPVEWSPDDKSLLLWNYVSVTESYIHILDIGSGVMVEVDPSDTSVGINGVEFSKDGQGVYLASDRDAEFYHLKYHDLQSGESRLISGHVPWNVEDFDLSDDGKHLAYVTNENGISKLHLINLARNREMATPELPTGLIDSVVFHPKGDRLALAVNTARSPRDIFVYSLKNKRLTQWTESEVGGLDTGNFALPELVSYPTFDEVAGDRRQIPAFLYKPREQGPHPVIVSIHGGPESQFRPRFISSFQFYAAELGFAVIAPNVRGSAGYGKTYLGLDNGFRREDSVQDIGALLDWIDTRDDLDGSRVVVVGGSYGGYMVLSTLTHYNDRLLGGIDFVGISNFVTFLENTRDYRRDLRRQEYGDERDPKMRLFLDSISPNTNAHKIRRPLLVVQGLNDPRVPVTESEQMVATIRENGGEVRYLLAKDEGHGFGKKQNRDFYYGVAATFLKDLLDRSENAD